MKKTTKFLLTSVALLLTPLATQAADTTHQRFIFVADFASDNPGLDPVLAPSLVAKMVNDARSKGFNYGDSLWLKTVPGGHPEWDLELDILKSAGNHPEQLEGFLNSRLSKMRESTLPDGSDVMWALQSLSNVDCSTPTVIYVISNGISAIEVSGDDVDGSGTMPGALDGCSLVWAGLSLKDTQGLSMTARIRVDNLFGQISSAAGARHDILR